MKGRLDNSSVLQLALYHLLQLRSSRLQKNGIFLLPMIEPSARTSMKEVDGKKTIVLWYGEPGAQQQRMLQLVEVGASFRWELFDEYGKSHYDYRKRSETNGGEKGFQKIRVRYSAGTVLLAPPLTFLLHADGPDGEYLVDYSFMFNELVRCTLDLKERPFVAQDLAPFFEHARLQTPLPGRAAAPNTDKLEGFDIKYLEFARDLCAARKVPAFEAAVKALVCFVRRDINRAKQNIREVATFSIEKQEYDRASRCRLMPTEWTTYEARPEAELKACRLLLALHKSSERFTLLWTDVHYGQYLCTGSISKKRGTFKLTWLEDQENKPHVDVDDSVADDEVLARNTELGIKLKLFPALFIFCHFTKPNLIHEPRREGDPEFVYRMLPPLPDFLEQ